MSSLRDRAPFGLVLGYRSSYDPDRIQGGISGISNGEAGLTLALSRQQLHHTDTLYRPATSSPFEMRIDASPRLDLALVSRQ